MWTRIQNMGPVALNNIAKGIQTVVGAVSDIKIDVVELPTKPLRSYTTELGELITKQKEEAEIHKKAIDLWKEDIAQTELAKDVSGKLRMNNSMNMSLVASSTPILLKMSIASCTNLVGGTLLKLLNLEVSN